MQRNPSLSESSFPEPNPERIAEMRRQGLEPLKLAHVIIGEDLGPELMKLQKSKPPNSHNPSLPTTPTDLTAPEPVETA